jgi:ankyrin repeat protein
MATNDVTAFCRALWRHESKTIAALAGRVDPNGMDRWNHTPLVMAAQHGDLPLVALLVRRGADLDQGRTHLTPLTFAARRRASDIVTFLQNRGATPSIVTWIHLGDLSRCKQALARDPGQSRLRDEEGAPVVHHAAEALQPALVELLLEHGAEVGEADPNGETALHRVANMRQAPQEAAAAMATLLIDRGADINARNWDDVTPLHQAVRARNLSVVEVLLARGADPNARDRLRGSTPLRRAVSGTGASLTAGTSSLMVPLTRLLLEHGADPNARDKRGVPVYASARAPDVVAVLAAHRAARRSAKKATETRRPPKRKSATKAPKRKRAG